MEISFTIPNQYVDRIKEAFDVETIAEFKEKVTDLIKQEVRNAEEETAKQDAAKTVTIVEDLIE